VGCTGVERVHVPCRTGSRGWEALRHLRVTHGGIGVCANGGIGLRHCDHVPEIGGGGHLGGCFGLRVRGRHGWGVGICCAGVGDGLGGVDRVGLGA
jgi:hypothetical protein